MLVLKSIANRLIESLARFWDKISSHYSLLEVCLRQERSLEGDNLEW